MGGKNKQRTKGNVRPSSSSKAAELLVKDKGTVPGFVGFGPSQNELGYVPAVQGFEEVDNSVDPDFRMVLRKMSKRDATTKLKAVQEFGAMCKERDPETIKAVLPYWSRIYCKISLDHDRRIREAAQQAFELLVFQVKRNLAPYLKNIMGYWLISQCDTYTPAASAAKQAFQAAFPPPKQPEAMAFCKEEITNILYDNIMKETPDTLSDPQSVPEEEREGKYQRVVTSSLLALKKLLDLLPENECMILKDRLMELLSQPKFWKYSKHKTPQIRSAFFELIVAFCQHLPELMKAEAAKVCSAVLLNIDDSDPVVCPSIWEAILYVLTCIEDCWSHVNAKKGVLPKLWTLLKEGGRGLATVVYPSLLPFISKLPEEVIGSKMDFFTIFFSTFNKGLVSDRAAVSCSESSAIVTAFMECLRFTLHQNLGEDEDQHKLQQMLINDQLLPLLQFTLKTPKLQNGTFCHLVDILTSWEKRVDNPEIEECAGAYRKLLSIFWDGLSQLCLSQVARMDTDKNLLDGVSSLLQFLENPVRSRKQSVKKKRSIRFLDEAETKDGENNIANRIAKNVHGCEQLSVTSRLVQQNSPSRTEPLESLVHELAKLAMTFIKEQNSEKHLEFLIGLTSLFPSRKLFIVLLENVDPVSPGLFLETNDEVKAMANNPAVQFLYQKLIFWFKESRADLNCLVDMLYSVLHCCNNNQERKVILNQISEMECGWLILLQIIQKACADPAKYAAVSDWLKGEILGEKLVVLTEELCTMGITHSTQPNDGGAHSWILLSLALSKRINNEFLIAEVYIERIIERLHNALSKANDLSKTGTQEPSISFVCDLASNFFCSIKGCLQMSSAGDLLLTIFQLCAQSQEKTLLSDVELHKLQQTWLLGLTSLISQQGGCFRRDGFFHNSALWVKKQVQTSELDIKSLQILLSCVCVLLDNLLKATQSPGHVLPTFLEYMVPNKSEWENLRQKLNSQWLNKVLLKGQISLNRDALCTRIDSHSSEKIPNHLCAAALLTQVALRIQENNVFEEKYLPLVCTPQIAAEMMYSLQWCEEMKDFCPVSEYCGLLLQLNITHDRLRKACSTLDETLFNRSLESGLLWALATSQFISKIKVDGDYDLKRLYGTVERFFPLTEANLHTIQSIAPFILQEDKELLVVQSAAKLSTSKGTDITSIDGGFGCLAVLNSCLQKGANMDEQLFVDVLSTMMNWRNNEEEIFFFDGTLENPKPNLLGINVEILRFLRLLIKYLPSSVTAEQWDFVMCSMLTWLQTVCETVTLESSPLMLLFACQSCGMLSDLSNMFQTLTPEISKNVPSFLPSEWSDFFVEEAYSQLLPQLIKILDQCKGTLLFPTSTYLLTAFGEAAAVTPLKQLINHSLPAKLIAGQSTNLPDKLQTLLNTFAPLLLFLARPVQITVYHLLHKLMPELPVFDNEQLKSCEDNGNDEEHALSPPAALMTVIGAQEEDLENIFSNVPVGEYTVIEPLSEAYYCVLGYLLAWKLILVFFKASQSELRVQYATYLRKSKSLHKLLQHLFRLMPENPTIPGQVSDSSSKGTKTLFTEHHTILLQETENLHTELPQLACSVYYSVLEDLPATVRLWWNSQDKRISSTVDRYTSRYVSHVLSSQEIAAVQTSTQTFTSMMVKARPAAREVLATYSVDDIFIELVIQLPTNYPLGSITVESGKRVGVAVQQWRNWMLQLNTFLNLQNGSIMEGLTLWKSNVDKRFEGIEECMICFSVIHGSNCSLPKKACRTCKKKFHSACLYRWFTSSNKSTCPLCRETFF
ncbi:E3 ubiquitin-protein ligase listerin [Callorhinchus milii]|uniref:E3 ubiquitin-protein ligase listerin n=2 Tax=Callorhinchus milii TaxID=7868 RepID=A0A4W3I6H7_CALMI|nr:E3 ubiquitin-protein ligase listerin [Callorhinchus milii]|eukprot:gi/632937365/ref/XP_007899350.1/ PREDICTED: E3 ubiquitin-protein ligase listerin [Callorhinchus milii]